MKKGLAVVLFVATGFVFSNCSARLGGTEVQGARLGSSIEIKSLSRKDYKVLSNVKGEATASFTRILIFWTANPGISWSERDAGSISGFGILTFPWTTLSYAQDQATFNALKSVPSADLILQPRFSQDCKESFFPIFYTSVECKVTVTGKAISINEG